jgi:hypothetical protein
VTGGGKKAAADQAGPEAVVSSEELGRESKPEIEYLEFVRGLGYLSDVRPATRDLIQDHEETKEGAGNVEEHLDDIGPDDRGHAALESVEEGQTHDHGDGDDLAGAQDDRNNDGDREHTNSLGQGSQQQKRSGREPADPFAKAAAHQFIGGVHFAPEIMWQEES